MSNQLPQPFQNEPRDRHGGEWPRLTCYRLLVFALTAGFGLSKAMLSYQGQSTAPNTLDWLYGVGAFLTLYWLGIYEKYAIREDDWFFDVDIFTVIKRRLGGNRNDGLRAGLRND